MKYLVVTATFRFPLPPPSPTMSDITDATLREYPRLSRDYLDAVQMDEEEDRDYAVDIEEAHIEEGAE